MKDCSNRLEFKFQKKEVMTNSEIGKDIIKKEIPVNS